MQFTIKPSAEYGRLDPDFKGKKLATCDQDGFEKDRDLPHRIRLSDDDRNVYFYGRTDAKTGQDWCDIMDWGAWYAGCTILDEWKDGEWVNVIS